MRQRGGTILGEGGFGRIRTIDDLPEGKYTVDYVNLRDGELHSVLVTREHIVKLFGNRVVYKEITHKSSVQQRHEPVIKNAAPRFIADFMKKWTENTDDDVGREETAKWSMLSEVLRKGVRFPPVDVLMPLYSKDDDVFLCIRTTDRLFPVYKYMHGDVVTLGQHYTPTVNHIIAISTAVLDCCEMLQVFGGIHHCDIKPENVLFRVRGVRPRKSSPPEFGSSMERHEHTVLSEQVRKRKKTLEFVLSDFGSAISSPTARDLRDAIGTGGYMCPLMYDSFEDFRADYEDRLLRKYAVLPQRHIKGPAGTALRLWDSYAQPMKHRDQRDFDVDEAMVKNDLFALGATLLNFQYESPSPLEDLAIDLLDGMGIWKIARAQSALERIRSTVDGTDEAGFVRFIRRHQQQAHYAQQQKPISKKAIAKPPAGAAVKRTPLLGKFKSIFDTELSLPPPYTHEK